MLEAHFDRTREDVRGMLCFPFSDETYNTHTSTKGVCMILPVSKDPTAERHAMLKWYLFEHLSKHAIEPNAGISKHLS